MIYFIDEDTGGRSAYPIALSMSGLVVETIPDATRALATLPGANGVDLVIIDVMLARGLDPVGNFSEETTGKGLRTGLRLLELLCECRAEAYPSRAVLLSAATDAELVKAIREVSDRLGVPYWRKEQFRSTGEFCRAVLGRIEVLKAS